MALTEPVTAREELPVSVAPAGRSLISRLSIGHVVMILAGLVAILLNLAFLRSSTDTVNIAVASRALEAGTVLGVDAIAPVEVGAAGELVQGLLTQEARRLYSVRCSPGTSRPVSRSADPTCRPAGSTLALREYSIEVDAANAAGGSIQDTDVVDIIAVIDKQAFYVAAGLEVVRVSGQ